MFAESIGIHGYGNRYRYATTLNGAVTHAFCHILYKGLLWMSMGAVLYRTGRTKCTELGGLV